MIMGKRIAREKLRKPVDDKSRARTSNQTHNGGYG
jgi:hypothetical protein